VHRRQSDDEHAFAGDRRPVYLRLAGEIARQIVNRRFPVGGRLPQEREFCRLYGVSRGTIRSALQLLEAQGLVVRMRGKGTFVAAGQLRPPRWFSTAAEVLLVQFGPESGAGTSYYECIAKGVGQAARVLGLELTTRQIASRFQTPQNEYKLPRPAEICGVVLCGTFDHAYIELFGSEDIPVVVVDFWTHDSQTDSVSVDIEGEAHMAVEHLARLGHATVGFVCSGRYDAQDQRSGYDPDVWRMLDNLRRAAQRQRMQLRDEWVVTTSAPGRQFDRTAAQFLTLRSRPSAVICFDAELAGRALKVAEQNGVQCPRDLSLITRGAPGDERVLGREVTCLVSNPELMGQTAVKLLVERINGQRHSANKIAVSSRLHVGHTTAPAPQDH